MSDSMLFLFGVVVFGLLGSGVGFTVAEFRSMAREIASDDGRHSPPRRPS